MPVCSLIRSRYSASHVITANGKETNCDNAVTCATLKFLGIFDYPIDVFRDRAREIEYTLHSPVGVTGFEFDIATPPPLKEGNIAP